MSARRGAYPARGKPEAGSAHPPCSCRCLVKKGMANPNLPLSWGSASDGLSLGILFPLLFFVVIDRFAVIFPPSPVGIAFI